MSLGKEPLRINRINPGQAFNIFYFKVVLLRLPSQSSAK